MASFPAATYKICERHQGVHEAFGGENGSLRAPDMAVLLSVPRVRIHFLSATESRLWGFSARNETARVCGFICVMAPRHRRKPLFSGATQG